MQFTNTISTSNSIEALILNCIEAGVKLGLNDNRLSVKAPKNTDLADIIEALKLRKDEVEAYLQLDHQREKNIARGPVRLAENDGTLSSGQERFWFLFQFEEDSSNYNMFGAYKIVGQLDYMALDKALQAIVFRHDVFRSYIEDYDGTLVSKTAPVSRVHIPVDDLTDLPEQEREAATQEWIDREAKLGIDVGIPPLCRFRLIKTSDNEHLFAFSVHHIICDGLSEFILLQELDHWYEQHLLKPDVEVPEMAVRYCDFAAWQKQYIGSMRYLKDIAWWRQNLNGAPPLLQVPTDKPRLPGIAIKAREVRFTVDETVAERLWQIGRDNGSTNFLVGLTLFGLLMRDYAGQDDMVIGTPVSNRNHAELERMVGFFVNTVPMRMTFDKQQSFAHTLQAVTMRSLESFDHSQLPVGHLMQALDVKRDTDYHPIFQSMFVLQEGLAANLDNHMTGPLDLRPMDSEIDVTTFDFDLTLITQPDGTLSGSFGFNENLYHVDTIERIAERFAALLKQVAETPEMTLADLRQAGTCDERSISIGVGDTVAYDLNTTLDAQIAVTTAANPHAVAVQHNDWAATYKELDTWSQACCSALSALGVGPNTIVAIETPRGVPFLAAIIGVMRTGGCYVPIDPQYPDDRRNYMIDDSAATVVIRSQDSEEAPATSVVVVDDVSLYLFTRKDGRRLNPPLEGESAVAYMIYTSGSTGRPKGAMVRHDGALNHIYAEVEALSLADDFVFLQTAASSSDISVWQFLGPLIYGGRAVIVNTCDLLDANALFKMIHRTDATLVELVPTVVQLLCEYAKTLSEEQRQLPKLRYLMITGEAAPVPLVNDWLELFPNTPMVNAYGPTEAADDVCQAIISEPVPESLRTVSIGTPLPNLSMYVLDADLSPVPIGACAEICVAGVGVGAGYHEQPDRTAQAFVTNPYATGESDKHLYRTGDLGRWRSDGQLDFIGRADTQVKIRGFRVELGEVTACMLTDERIREAATIVSNHEDAAQLVGYYSTVDNAEVTPKDLRQHLKNQLPKQYVPNTLVALENLPHLPNGKIDLNNLPKPQAVVAAPVDESGLTDTQREVRKIVAELLQVPNVPLDADFFEYGGHSLLAVRLIARIREQFNKEIPIAHLFATPMLGDFCALVDATAESNDIVHIQAANKTRYPLSPGQARLWFLNLFEGESNTHNLPGALHMRGERDVAVIERAIKKLFARHPSLRTRIVVENGLPYQEIMPDVPLDFPVIDLSDKDSETAQQMLQQRIDLFTETKFKLDTAPMLRAELVKFAADDYYLLIVAHHIITDGISNGILGNELLTLYNAEMDGNPDAHLTPLEYQYGDFSEWQLAIQSTNHYRRQLLYWERKLIGAPALLALPTDRPRPAMQTYNGTTLEFTLPQDLMAGLHQLAQANSVTSYMLFQAAVTEILRRYSRQNDIVTGTYVGGRRIAELMPLVGFFTNTIVVRTAIDPERDFVSLLADVRTTAVEAFDNSDVPFEQVIDRTNVERNPAFSPIFQVVVAYEAEFADRNILGTDIEIIEIKKRAATFDLNFLFEEKGDNIICKFSYNTDLFFDETMHRMASHLQILLAAVVAQPNLPIGQIELTSDDELTALKALENTDPPTWTNDATLVSVFNQNVDKYAERTAVCDGVRSMSYSQLDVESAGLAIELAKHEVRSGDFVAIVADRSIELLTAILAIMRAGAAYVPVDPSYPQGRIAHMLNDSAAEVIVTTAAHLQDLLSCLQHERDCTILVMPDDSTAQVLATLETPVGITVVSLSSPQGTVSAPAVEIAPDAAAYMIYTSGSTGTPKGAINTHQGQLNHILAEAQLLQLGDHTVMAQTAPASSDISVWQFVGSLMIGGTTAIISTEELIHSDRLLARIGSDGINLIELVPALYDHLLDYIDELSGEARLQALVSLGSLTAAMITGEAAPVPTINRWIETVPGVPVINAYGPTEAADDICQYRIDETLHIDTRHVPIGRPIPGMTITLLDENLRRVPLGVPGEICVSGVGVGSGYWRQPELTSNAFVANPFASGEFDKTLYRTGDLGRWNSDGQLVYLGRRDGQVNLLGMRIELGEIESAVTALTPVREAAVVVIDERPPRLGAFWVAAGAHSDEKALEEQLRSTLPSHMVPSTWIQLQQLPRTPMGKVDYARLKEGAAKVAFASREYVAPESDDERALTAIWAEVLDSEKVSVNANFFEWGGNSLLAVQAARRVEEQFGVSVPLVDFFRQPTLSGVLDTIIRLRQEQAAEAAQMDEVDLA